MAYYAITSTFKGLRRKLENPTSKKVSCNSYLCNKNHIISPVAIIQDTIRDALFKEKTTKLNFENVNCDT